MKKQLFINKFQKGSNENANLGIGNIVGFDTYSKKGVTLLSKQSTISQTFTTKTPHFFATSNLGLYLWCLFDDGSVYYSTDSGVTWTAVSSAVNPTAGCGLILFQQYMFAFDATSLYYWLDTSGAHGIDPSAGAWVNWKTGLQNLSTSPISGSHFPFLYPNSRGFYFCNGGYIGFVGQVGTTLFNPAGVQNTDYLFNDKILTLPGAGTQGNVYSTNTLDFLPPNKLAISAYAFQNPQGADLITWDTVSANKFDPPLRLYSNSNGLLTGNIKQFYNRSQVLYAVSGGNHTVYETNGSTFNLVADIALYSNVRSSGGAESTYPVFYNSYPQAITVLGNKLLTGTATGANTATYPPTGKGIFPIGVWSIAFNIDGTKSTQCEFIVPSGNNPTSPAGNTNYSKVTCLLPIGSGKVLVGYKVKDTNLSLESGGIAVVNSFSYVNSLAQTSLESEMFEIGTALVPQTVNNIEINLVKNLLTGHTIDISYRTSFDQDWTVLDTYTGDGTKNYYALTSNPIGATQFIQLRVRASAESPNANESPEIRTVILS